MTRIVRILVSICLLSASALCQERMTKTVAGPQDNGQFRVAVAFMSQAEASYKLESLIVTVNSIKKPTDYYVDLTTTDRLLESGAKQQKILVFRWDKRGDIEIKCDGGKWVKQAAEPEINKIIEIVKSVVEAAPRDAKEPADFTLTAELKQKVISVLEGLGTSSIQCIRTGS